MGYDVKKPEAGQSNGSFGVKEGKMPKKKRKGLHGFPKFLVVFFSTILGVVVLVIGAAYACFYDPTHTVVPVQENYDKDQLFNEILVDSLDHASCAEHEVKLDLRESQLNSILAGLVAKNPDMQKFIKNLYIDTNTNTFAFVLEFNLVNLFKTRIFITSTYRMEDENGDKTLIFDITDLKIGRIGGMTRVLSIFTGMLPLPDLSKMLGDAGIHMKVDLINLKISYKVSDFCNDIKDAMEKMGTEVNGFLQLVLEILTADNFEDIRQINGPEKGSVLSFSMDLDSVRVTSDTHGAEGYVVPNGYFSEELDYVTNAIRTMLNDGTLDDEHATTKECDLIGKYIMGGDIFQYSGEETAEINRLKNAGAFTGLSIPQYDYNLPNNEKLENVILSKIPTTVTTETTIDVTSNEVNNSLRTTPSTGIIASFIRNTGTEEEKDYKLNYVCSDRIGLVTNNDTLYLVINMTVNGYNTNLTFVCPRVTSFNEYGKAKFSISELRYGDCVTSNAVKEEYLKVLKEALTGEGLSGVVHYNEGSLTLDVSSILNSKGITQSNCDVDILVNNYDPSSVGGLSIKLTPKF